MQKGLATQDYHATTNVLQQITVQFYNHRTFHLKQFSIYSTYLVELSTNTVIVIICIDQIIKDIIIDVCIYMYVHMYASYHFTYPYMDTSNYT